MMNRAQNFTGLVVLLTMFLAACGSDSSDEAGSQLSYTGSTEPMELRADNTADLLASVASGALSTPVRSTGGAPAPSVDVPIRLANTIRQNVISKNSSVQQKAIITGSYTVLGICGGSASVSYTFDDVTFDMSMSISYMNYCIDDVTYEGNIELTSTYDDVNYITTATILAPELVFRNNSNGDVFMIMNYDVVVVTDEDEFGFLESETVDVSSAEYYYPVDGYISINTPVPLVYGPVPVLPLSGELEVVSSAVATDYDKAKIVIPSIVDPGTYDYDIYVDLAGDGNNDYEPDPLLSGNW